MLAAVEYRAVLTTESAAMLPLNAKKDKDK
jgi:hypothetical protein